MKPIRTPASFAVAAALMLSASAAQAVEVFDFRSEPYPGSSNGLFTLPGEALSPATFTNDNGRTIEILTFLSGGSVRGYALDTFGSGPPPFGNTAVYDQRAYFYFGPTGGPLVDYQFWTTVKLVSATFVLYSPSQNLNLSVEPGTAASTDLDYFFETDVYDEFIATGTNAPLLPAEITVTFDGAVPLTDQITMRSLGGSGVALKTLIVDPVDLGGGPGGGGGGSSPVPIPATGLLLLSGLGVGAAFARRRARV